MFLRYSVWSIQLRILFYPCQRYLTAAAEINGAIYVAGGYDGKDYLK